MSEKRLVLIGAGGHAKVVLAAAKAAGFAVEALYDDDPSRWGGEVLGAPVRGPVSSLEEGTPAVLAIGSNEARKRLAARHRFEWQTVVHPMAWIHESVALGPGTVVFAGAVVQPEAKLGAHVIVNTGATVDHDCEIGDYAHLAPGTHLAGNVAVGEGAFLGVGAAAIPGISIGAWTRVGAGGVVVKDLPPHVTAVGVPAKPRVG